MKLSVRHNNSLLVSLLMVFSVTRLQAAEIKTIYTWTYDNNLYTMVYYFDQSTYNYYKGQDRIYNNFLFYLNESARYPVMEQFAGEFKAIAAENKMSDWQLVECVIAFIQTMKYKNDGTYEYPRYPIETLVEKGGDCEDTAILLEAILKELGFDCVLVSPTKHMGVGIALKYEINGVAFQHRNKYYYYIETTSAGWGIGDYPDHLSADVSIYDPGDVDGGKLLSEYSYTFKNYTNEDVVTTQNDYAQENLPEPEENLYEFNDDFDFEATPENSYTIDVDQVVIDGEKETVVTKKVESGGKEKIVATSK